MLAREDNERVTRVGRGTPMGEAMRRYWIPALLGWELPEPDCPPVRVKLLGEELVAFRDTQGRIGILDERCPHRQASYRALLGALASRRLSLSPLTPQPFGPLGPLGRHATAKWLVTLCANLGKISAFYGWRNRSTHERGAVEAAVVPSRADAIPNVN